MCRVKETESGPRDVLGNHRRQSQQSRVELGALSQRLIAKERTIFVADAHRDNGNRFVVHADEEADCVSGIRIGDSPLRQIALTQ